MDGSYAACLAKRLELGVGICQRFLLDDLNTETPQPQFVHLEKPRQIRGIRLGVIGGSASLSRLNLGILSGQLPSNLAF